METNLINLSMVRQSLLSDDSYLEYLDGDYPVDCKCPKCGKVHRVTMFWTGRGVPRKYCLQCKGRAEMGYGGTVLSIMDTTADAQESQMAV